MTRSRGKTQDKGGKFSLFTPLPPLFERELHSSLFSFLYAPGEDSSSSTRMDSDDGSENHANPGRPGVAECRCRSLFIDSGGSRRRRRRRSIVDVPFCVRFAPLFSLCWLQRPHSDVISLCFCLGDGEESEKKRQGLCRGGRDRYADGGGEWRGESVSIPLPPLSFRRSIYVADFLSVEPRCYHSDEIKEKRKKQALS